MTLIPSGDWLKSSWPILVLFGLGLGGGGLGSQLIGVDQNQVISLVEDIDDLEKEIALTRQHLDRLQSDVTREENQTDAALRQLADEISAMRDGLNHLLRNEGLDPVRR